MGTQSNTLGTIAKIASTFEKNELVLRFYLQSLARDLLPEERVRDCMRTIAPFRSNVEIKKSDGRRYAHYSNLVVCARIWQCPVCAATITEKRRKELTLAIAESGLHPILITYTLRHNERDKMNDVLRPLLAGFRALKSGRAWQDFTSEYGWIGSIRSLETTYGQFGWHPHLHELALLEIPVDGFIQAGIERFIKQRWSAVIAKQGRDANWENGANVQTEEHRIREYVAKYGHLPKDMTWTIEHELTKSPSKKKGKLGGLSPLQLLMAYGQGSVKAGRLFVEYAAAFKGRNQLVWSRGLKALLGLDDGLTDEAIAQEDADRPGQLLATLSREQWKAVVKGKFRAELLNVASTCDEETLYQYIAEILECARAGTSA